MTRHAQIEARAGAKASIETMQAAYSLDAVGHAAAQSMILDYSEASLQAVETILDRMHREKPGKLARMLGRGPTDAQIDSVAKMYGAYVGEVMRFEWGGGEWQMPNEGPFAGAVALVHDGSFLSPTAKAWNRLTNGAEDNIMSYYKAMDPRTGAAS